ncbi:hypothetical protein BC826DRAFT_325373 [Russula brevipes]|nr:hypothetical protein BC826DRAFT_325373 [Russula brevipes]
MVLNVELGHFLRSWNKTSNGRFDLYVESIIGLMVSFVRERNDRWIALAVDHLGISEPLLRHYLAHGDSLLLASYIHYTRLLIRSDWVPIRTLTFLSEFDIHNTLPELQHEFCALWNELVREAHNDGPYCRPAQALLYIRSIYIVLHRDSDAASTPFFHPTANFDYVLDQVVSSDPFCKDPSHLPEHMPDVVDGPIGESAHLLTTTAQCRDSVPTAATPPSSLPPASHPVDIALQPANEPSLDDLPAPISKSSRSVPRMSPSNPATPLDSSATTPRQANIGCPAISSMATTGPHSPRAATTPISPTTAGLSSGTTIAPPHSADRVLHSPSVAPGTPFSSSPASPPIRSDSLPPVLASSSQSIQAPPNQTLLHPHSATSPLIARPGSSTPDPVSNEAILGALDDS